MGDVIPIHMVAEGSFPFIEDSFLVLANSPTSPVATCWPASVLRAAHCRCMNYESFRRPSNLLRTETECRILHTTRTVALSYFMQLTM